MSTPKPAPPAKPAAAPAKPAAGGAAVIRKIEGAEETAHDRLTKKILPAWVISGAMNVSFLAIAYVFSILFAHPEAVATTKVITTTVEPENKEDTKDLTNEDIGLQSDLEAAVDVERLDKVNVEAKVTEDSVGTPDGKQESPDTFAPPGAVAENATGGVAGDAGAFLTGTGGGGGHQMASGMVGRSGATKNKLIAAGGGNDASEAAVARGLAWLARQQKADGSWVYDGSHKTETTASTGMGLLPFLAAGETHKTGKKYQKNVAQGIKFLLSMQQSGGNFRGAKDMYAQAIGALALIECYGMTKDAAYLKGPAQKAVNMIQEAQGANGSWGYSAKTEGDTSIVGWQIQALHSAKISGLVVSADVLRKANAFLDSVSGGGSNKSTYGYRTAPGAPGTSLTAVGLLCRYYEAGWGPNNPGMAAGVVGLMGRPPRQNFFDMYYYYYATQVVHFFETDAWYKEWNPKMRDMLIGLQVKKDGANYGSWDADTGTIGRSCGRLGTTCMALLTLEVYYRHLPLYKRGNDGGGLKELDRAN